MVAASAIAILNDITSSVFTSLAQPGPSSSSQNPEKRRFAHGF
jgi:hypothetical protein